jgi:hypothetical protein
MAYSRTELPNNPNRIDLTTSALPLRLGGVIAPAHFLCMLFLVSDSE